MTTEQKTSSLPKPSLKLVGEDGNAFMIVGRAMKAAKAAGWPKEAIDAFQKQAFGGDYNALLCLCMEKFEVDEEEEDYEDEENEWDLDDDCDEDEEV